MAKKSTMQKMNRINAALGNEAISQKSNSEEVEKNNVKSKENEGKLLFVLLVMAILTFAVTLFLLAKDKPTTLIELEVVTLSVQFETSIMSGHQIPLLSNFELESIDLPNFNRVEFFWTDTPPSGIRDAYEASEMESLGGGLIVNEPTDIIGIDELLIPDKSKVELKKLIEPEGKFQLALFGNDIGLTVQVAGSPSVSLTGFIPNEQKGNEDQMLQESFDLPAVKGADIDFLPLFHADNSEELVMNFVPKLEDSPQARLFIDDQDGIQDSIDIETQDSKEILFGEQIEISNLSITRVNESQRAADGSRVPRRVSAIESGTLYLEELNGKAIPLRPGEQLQFKVLKGTIRKLSLQDDLITLQFRGTVEGIISGFVDSRSLMPSWLQYIQAREAWLAVVGGVFTALFLVFAYLQGRGAMR